MYESLDKQKITKESSSNNMNVRNKLVSKIILLIPYFFSIFKPVQCLSMNNNVVNTGCNFSSTNTNNWCLGYVLIPCAIPIPSSLFLFSYLSDFEKHRVTNAIEYTIGYWIEKKSRHPMVAMNIGCLKPYLYNIINEIGNMLLSEKVYVGEAEYTFKYFIRVIYSVVTEILCMFEIFVKCYNPEKNPLELKYKYRLDDKCSKHDKDISNLYFKNFGKCIYKFNNKNTELKVEEDKILQKHCKLIEENLVSIGYVVTSIFKDWKAKLSISYPSEEEFVIQVIKQ